MLTGAHLFGAASDSVSLVLFEEIGYGSDKEKQLFAEFSGGNVEYHAGMFMLMDEKADETLYSEAEAKLQSALTSLNGQDLQGKSEKKTIKAIYEEIHDPFLVNYEDDASFSDIFKSGTYNCLTASILYGLIFEELDIPYSVKVSENNVYLVAWPGTKSIPVENRNPLENPVSYDSQFMQQAVQQMKDAMIISNYEFNTTTTADLFDKYYFREADSDLGGLAGILYYNKGITLMQEHRFRDAFFEFEKSWLLYPSQKTEYHLRISLVGALEEAGYNNFEYALLLSRLSRYGKLGITAEQVTNEFIGFTSEILETPGDITYYDSVFHYLDENIKDEEVHREISFVYHCERGQFLLASDLSEALEDLVVACGLNPHNEDLKNLFIEHLQDHMAEIEDPQKILQEIGTIKEHNPSLMNEPVIRALECKAYLLQASENFGEEMVSEGLEKLLKFEELHRKGQTYFYADDALRVYSQAAMYYYEKGDFSNSKEIINRGLEILPNNTLLLQYLKKFNQ